MQILNIKHKLLNDEINFSEALNLIKKLPKPWHTEEWKSKRDKILKGDCEQCGSDSPPMVAQHLVQPPSYKNIRNALFEIHYNEELEKMSFPDLDVSEEDIEQFHQQYTYRRSTCPECNGISIRKRKTMLPEYFCDQCKLGFDTPYFIDYNELFGSEVLTNERVRNYLISQNRKSLEQDFRKKLFKESEKQIGKKSVLMSIEYHLKYISLNDVVTFCKRCAYKMDRQKKLLCWNCKSQYFIYLNRKCCYKCYKTSNRKSNPFQKVIINKAF